MKANHKKITLLLSGLLTASLGITTIVACTPQNQRKENENAQLSSNNSEGISTKPQTQQTLVPILNKIEKKIVSQQNSFILNLTLSLQNVNDKFVQVVLTSNSSKQSSSNILSNKVKVINDKAEVVFNNLDKSILYSLEKVNIFNNETTSDSSIVTIPENISKAINQDFNNQEQKNNQMPSLQSKVQWSSLRVGHWNVLHQDGSDNDKNEALAKVILHHHYDVIGLTEIMPTTDQMNQEQKQQAVKKVVDLMNKLSNSNDYSYLISDNMEGSENKALATPEHTSTERVGLIYNNKKVKPIAFANGKIGHIYSNPLVDGKWTKQKVDYSRPPFSVKMQSIGDVENDFTLVFAHFDSPGKYPKREDQQQEKKEISYSIEELRNLKVERTLKYTRGKNKGEFVEKDQGSRELDDAENIVNVIEEVKKIDQNKDDDFFFLADTNIRLGNENWAFKKLKETGFNNLLKDHFDDRTTLSVYVNNMSNPYDKIFKKSNLETKNPGHFKLWDVFKKKILDKNWYERVKSSNQKAKNWLENKQTFPDGKEIKKAKSEKR